MKKITILFALSITVGIIYSFQASPNKVIASENFSDSLRKIYSGPIENWPKPNIDPDLINYRELGILPDSPLKEKEDSLKPLIELGRVLFFDPRLSGSGQISCSSCHAPSLSWTDGLVTARGHDHLLGERNTPTILNVWTYDKLFWDGRANSLEDQALGPINSEIEMHGDFGAIISKLRRIKGYQVKFDSAYGSPDITPGKITHALATFQRTVISRKSRFDQFLEGKSNALTDQEIRGLHFFRTQGRCINCHNGPLFTDGQFHNIGLTYYGRKYEDLGLFLTTKNPEDVGKFKTPSLRDVGNTRPYMHNGLFEELLGIVNMYSSGMPQPAKTPEQKNDPLFPKTSKHIQKLDLSMDQRKDIVAFLEAITTTPLRVRAPELPK